jgi:hypothetical protein
VRDQGLRGHEWLSAQFAESKALRISQQRVADWHQQHTTYPLHATDADVVEQTIGLARAGFSCQNIAGVFDNCKVMSRPVAKLACKDQPCAT